jgi:hypothetical protein
VVELNVKGTCPVHATPWVQIPALKKLLNLKSFVKKGLKGADARGNVPSHGRRFATAVSGSCF